MVTLKFNCHPSSQYITGDMILLTKIEPPELMYMDVLSIITEEREDATVQPLAKK